MQTMARKFQGFALRSILIHSGWITVLGVLLFRLATANTQNIIYVDILAISGVVLATAPWVIQLIISLLIILTHNAGFCDLTWLVKPPVTKRSCCGCFGNSDDGDREIEDGGRWIVQHNGQELILMNGRNEVVRRGLGFNRPLQIEGGNGPKLQRNRTVWW